jgi:hypothetical protein
MKLARISLKRSRKPTRCCSVGRPGRVMAQRSNRCQLATHLAMR